MLGGYISWLFVVYQPQQAISLCHMQGVVHGNIFSRSILLSDKLWLRLAGFSGVHAKLEPESADTLVMRWRWREMSNFEHLLALNSMAGRRLGDPNFHPVMPWVIDFSASDAWRDAQLDDPHHVTDVLTGIAYCTYMAPWAVLRHCVRSAYEPEEYPSSMARLYKWTPNECIPEFNADAAVFRSMHADMPDLAVPFWADSAEDFVRDALESEQVSRTLHQSATSSRASRRCTRRMRRTWTTRSRAQLRVCAAVQASASATLVGRCAQLQHVSVRGLAVHRRRRHRRRAGRVRGGGQDRGGGIHPCSSRPTWPQSRRQSSTVPPTRAKCPLPALP